MVSVISFLKTNVVSQQKILTSFTLCLLLSACGKSSGGSEVSQSALACTPGTASLKASGVDTASEGASSGPSIQLDPAYDRYIVKFAEDTSQKGLVPSGNPIREYTVAGITLNLIQGRTYSVNLHDFESKDRAIEKLSQHRQIEFVEPDYVLTQIDDIQEQELSQEQVELLKNEDTFNSAAVSQVSQQWALNNVESSPAWAITRGSSEIVVAVVDSGIDYTHDDLKANIWENKEEIINGIDDDKNGYVDDIRGWNYVNNNNNPKTTSQSNHGTHVAGIIGAAGSVLGLSQKVKMMPLRFINEAGTGISSYAIRAIDYAINKKVFAINNSWGSGNKSKALQEAINRAEKAGILFVVAAGNGEAGKGYNISSKPWYPAAYLNSNILRVAASKSDNLLTAFSNYSNVLVDVAAPGSSILSTVTGNKYMKMSGTSMATPLVTGLAVLIKAANPSLNATQVRGIINTSVDVIPGLRNLIRTGGRVNARKAVQMAAQVGSEFVPSTCP